MSEEPQREGVAPGSPGGEPTSPPESGDATAPLEIGPRLQQELEAALRREQQRLSRWVQQTNSTLAQREKDLETHGRELDAREARVAESLQSARALGAQLESDARARAGEIVAEAQATAATIVTETKERYEAFLRAVAGAEEETAEIEAAAREEANRSIRVAKADAERILEHARREAEEILEDARRGAAEQSDRVAQLLRLREGLMSTLSQTVTQFQQVLDRTADSEVPSVTPAPEWPAAESGDATDS